MKVIYGNNQPIEFTNPTGIGLGNFDGLHIAHMALINTLINESKQRGLESVLYSFTKHPENIIRKKLFTPLITSTGKKIKLLELTQLDYTYFEEFDEQFSRMSPETFVKDILVDRFKMKLAVAGYDYRFGYKGQGDVAYLKELGQKYNYKVITIPAIKVDDEIVSSTLIRKYVKKGDMESAFKLLGRHYSITGVVEKGKRIGNTLGFPTANIYPEEYLLMPLDGVYVTRTLLDGKIYNSITNIGNNPTFSEQKKSIETYILDYSGNIYGKDIEVFFLKKIRGEKKFNSIDELVEQIRRDIEKARQYFIDFKK
ncbi:bifunctional riboflavin kinase/FAD synthetase [Acetivibrio clariflavus]|uniref:Riboflavin biosynthesis protein n=1 Tax=Acetivibrio clariflavus (strain DSM 19732 / NBRC 101661 / EBR45) TaxID=720554 RepID=G8LZT4_ACECE|nr:bifunctional riboflavin kinase/FAD synthetase [Acetivibrio clariflavus]AEV69024.1 riboflavin kinase/FMN adenylyltransferase [Acetivibrio clariflavus DSM 19732]HOQ00551.1 bifunctional riboflavin kinase/FAD synthetase [Acetivibrio clariflavus]